MTLVVSLVRRRLLLNCLFFVMVLTAVLWSLEGLTLVQTLLARGAILSTLKALFYSLPMVLSAVIPIAIACGGILLCSRLHDDGENASMQAAGIAPWRISLPFMHIGIIGTLVLLLLQIWLLPLANQQLRRLLSTIQPQEIVGLLRENDMVSPVANITMSVQAIRNNGELFGVFAEDRRDIKHTVVYSAQRASFKPTEQGSRLFLDQGHIQLEKNSPLQWPPLVDILTFERFVYNPDTADLQTAQPRKLREMTFMELLSPPNSLSSADKKRYQARAHEQINTALYPMVFMAVIAAIGLRPQPRRLSSIKRLIIASFALLVVRMVGVFLQNSAIYSSGVLWLTYIWPLIIMMSMWYIIKGGRWHKYMP